MKLTPEQADDLPFPIGCPVWYNFPGEKSSGNENTEEPPLLKQGVVESVSFNYGAKDLVYEVVYKDSTGANAIVEEVSQNNLAYGAKCPVTIDCNGDVSVDGIVLLCEPSSTNPSKIAYAVMIDMEGYQARFEVGIDAERIKYRKVKVDTKNAILSQADDAPAAASVHKETSFATNNDPSTAKMSASASAVHSTEGMVPSSITCDSVSKSSSRNKGERGTNSSNKHARASVIPSASPKNDLRVDTTLPGNHEQNKPDSGRSINSYSRDSVTIASGTQHNQETRIVMKIPLWLQRTQQCKRDLFFHLIGSKRDREEGRKRTIRHIQQDTKCSISVNNIDNDAPMNITVQAPRRSSALLDDLDDARQQIQELLLDFMDIIRDGGSKGRLLYEVASSYGSVHRPSDSTSYAVRVKDKDPSEFTGWRFTYMSLVELPFEFREGRKSYHAACLLTKSCLVPIRALGCMIRVCGDDFRVPLTYCDPHVLVTGRRWQNVDQAVDVVKNAIRWHMNTCSCTF